MNKKYKYRCLGYAEVEQDIWFANLYFNALMKMDRSTGRIEVIDRFPNYGVEQEWLYSTACYVNGYLIFVPNGSKEIAAYHIKKRQFITTGLDDRWIGEKRPYFVNAFVYGQYVYMFPAGASCIIRYDAMEHSVKYLQNCINNLINRMPHSCYCFYQQFEVVDGKIYLPFLELNAVAVFDLRSEEVSIRYMDIEGGCSTINYVKGFFYLGSWRTHKIYRWDHRTGEIETYQEFPDGFAGDHMFLCAHKIGGTLVFFPDQCNMIVSFSLMTKKIHKIQNIDKVDDESISTFFVQESKGISYIMMAGMECMNCLKYDSDRPKIIPCYRTDELYNKRQISSFLLENGYYKMVFEWERALEEYLDVLRDAKVIGPAKRRLEYGKRIFADIQKNRY